jgi:hypothetical protein
MPNLGDFYRSIPGVKLSPNAFHRFLESLRQFPDMPDRSAPDHPGQGYLTVERVEEDQWHAKWIGCEGCWIVALPVSEEEMRIDFYLLEGDAPEHPIPHEDSNGKVWIELAPNPWPRKVFEVVRDGLIELGVLRNAETPTPAKKTPRLLHLKGQRLFDGSITKLDVENAIAEALADCGYDPARYTTKSGPGSTDEFIAVWFWLGQSFHTHQE